MEQSNFFLSLAVSLLASSFLVMDASYHVSGKPLDAEGQVYAAPDKKEKPYDQLPKWEAHVHPIYAVTPVTNEPAVQPQPANFLQVPAAQIQPKARAVGKKLEAEAKQAQAALNEQASRRLQLQQQAQADEILHVAAQVLAKAAAQPANQGPAAAAKNKS